MMALLILISNNFKHNISREAQLQETMKVQKLEPSARTYQPKSNTSLKPLLFSDRCWRTIEVPIPALDQHALTSNCLPLVFPPLIFKQN